MLLLVPPFDWVGVRFFAVKGPAAAEEMFVLVSPNPLRGQSCICIETTANGANPKSSHSEPCATVPRVLGRQFECRARGL